MWVFWVVVPVLVLGQCWLWCCMCNINMTVFDPLLLLLSVNIAAVNRLLLLVCLTGTRSVSISLTKRAKDSSPLLTSSEFYRWVFFSQSSHICYPQLHVIDPECCVSPSLQSINVHIDENALHEILNEVDLNKNGQVEIDEFLQVGTKYRDDQQRLILSAFFSICKHKTDISYLWSVNGAAVHNKCLN